MQPVTPDFSRISRIGFPERVTQAEGLDAHPEHEGSPPPEQGTWNPVGAFVLPNEWNISRSKFGRGSLARLNQVRRRYKYQDRGTGMYEEQRNQGNNAHLVMTGRHAGRSNLHYRDFDKRAWAYHLWTKDFFTSIANINLGLICLFMLVMHTLSYIIFGIGWYIIYHVSPSCMNGFDSDNFLYAYMFAVETQATIGFGKRSLEPCWITSIFLTLQIVMGMILDAVSLGIIFAKISHPKHRGRSILISECAVIARRNGLLKFMFRVADIRSTTACDAKVSAFLYTWGEGRSTMEGEHIPVRVESLSLGNVDGMLLLPLTIEHTIDERSPLFGLSHEMLEANSSEIVVTFEAVSEFGDNFMVRQSYLANEIHWGHVFTCIIDKASPESTHHVADLSRFHDVEPQPGLPLLAPRPLSKKILADGLTMLPYPLLGENTLVLSSVCTITYRDGRPHLMFRVGDTRPCQMLEVHVRAYLYRWVAAYTPEGEHLPCTTEEVDLGYEKGRDRLILRFPQTISHEITPASPLACWATQERLLEQSCYTELVVIVEGYMYTTSSNMMRTVTYRFPNDVRHNQHFLPIVARSHEHGYSPTVDWSVFHATGGPGASPVAAPAAHARAQPSPAPALRNVSAGLSHALRTSKSATWREQGREQELAILNTRSSADEPPAHRPFARESPADDDSETPIINGLDPC